MTDASSQHTSPSLLARVKSDDSLAWQQLVDLYGPLVIQWCRRKGLNSEDGADVVQNVFLSVASGLRTWKPVAGQDGCFRAWLWTIAKHRIIDHLRAKPTEQAVGGSSNMRRLDNAPALLEEQFGGVESLHEEPTLDIDLTQLMHRAMQWVESSVERHTWQAFWRTVVDGLTTDAVAGELGISTSSVRQARSRVLRKIREQLGDC